MAARAKRCSRSASSTVRCGTSSGRWANAPVYKLLGGPIRTEIPAYASALGFSIEPEKAFERAKMFADQGYKATKWFVRNGPADGHEGIRKNVELIRTLREAVGPDVEIMIDAWMSWDVPYTVNMAELLHEYSPVLDRGTGDAGQDRRNTPRSARSSLVPTAGGEHEYTRWGIKQLLDARAVDFVQADTYWAGGISEMQKIFTLGSVYDIPVIPHGHSTPANIHLSAAQPVLQRAVDRVPREVERDSPALPQVPGQAGQRRSSPSTMNRVSAWTSTRRSSNPSATSTSRTCRAAQTRTGAQRGRRFSFARNDVITDHTLQNCNYNIVV